MDEEHVPRQEERKTVRLIATCCGAVVSLLIVVLFIVTVLGEGETAENPLVGEQAPSLRGAALGGEIIDLEDVEGWVAVNFFATWCAECIQEHPELAKFDNWSKQNGSASLISIVFDSTDLEDARRFFASSEDWPLLSAPQLSSRFGVAKIPETFLINPEGVVVHHVQGVVTADELIAVIEQSEGGGV